MLAKAGREISKGKLKPLFAFPLFPFRSSIGTETITSNLPFLNRHHSNNRSKSPFLLLPSRSYSSSNVPPLTRDGNHDDASSVTISVCLGCGGHMQNSNPKHPGFFIRPSIEKQKRDSILESNLHLLTISQGPEVIDSIKREVIVEPNSDSADLNPKDDETEKESSDGRPLVCARCHSLRRYGKVKDPTVDNLLPDFDFDHTVGRRLGSASGARTVVLMVVDASDFDGSFPKLVSRTIDENDRAWKEGKSGNVPRVVVVVTKMDLLPSSLSPTRFEQWVRQRAREEGLSETTKLHFVSPVKNWGIKDLVEDVAAMAGKRGQVWAVGSQNAGKSTLINAVRKVFGGKVWHLTEAPVPGTTLPFEAKLFDTPGLWNPHQITARLTREEQRLAHISREASDLQDQGYTVHIGGLMRLDIDESSVDSVYVTVWASPSVPLHMGKKENAHKTLEEHFGERRVEEMGKWVRKEFRVSGSSWDTSSVDIAVSGLGWFAVGLKGDAVLGVWTHEGIDVVVRDSLLPQRALTFEEDSGFTVSKIVAEADRAFNQNSCNADVEATMNFRPLLVSSHLLKITAPARLWRTCTFPAPVAPVSAEKPKRRFSSSPEPLGGAIGRTTISDIAAMVSPAVVHIHVPQDIYGGPDESSASGMCIDNVGTILTCAHVVLNPNGKYIKKDTYPPSGYKVSVTFADGKQFNGMVKKYDFDADLAIVSIGEPSQDFPSVVLGTSRDVRQGDFTVAIGSPLVLPRSVTFGIMSCIDRTKQEMLFWGGLDRLYFQTDCYTNKGSSGCPLVDLDGKVVAIHFRSLINSKNLHEAGCGFGIPIDDAKSFIGDYYM